MSNFSVKTAFICAIFVLTACTQQQQKKTYDESFVEVSGENPSYFRLSNGDTYIPIGLNIVHSRNDMETMERWIKTLSENGGNFIRIWLGHDMFEYETVYGQVNEEHIAKVDRVIEMAGKYGIKVKMCMENFRVIQPEGKGNNKRAYHVDNGGPFTCMNDYMSDERGQKVFLNRAKFFKERYGDNPHVFAWELWNEMNAIGISPEDKNTLLISWNASILSKMHEISPKNLITQSLGSLDKEGFFPHYDGIMRIPDNDIIQVHRYIDEGAELSICRAPMDILAADAIEHMKSYGLHKPILLAETGGVEPSHSGPHRAYENDRDGMILHDLLFAPYFTGSAGPGHAWHWDVYVDRNNLWYHFRRFSNAIGDLDPVKEGFEPLRADQLNFRVYILKGKKNSLVWIRDIENTWQAELINGIKPKLCSSISLNLDHALKNSKISKVSIYDPWTDQGSEINTSALVILPDFKRSIIVKVKH